MKTLKNTPSGYWQLVFFAAILLFVTTFSASAHCDSYAGPVIKDAIRALQTNNVSLVYKWISAADETEITSLFDKTYKLSKVTKKYMLLLRSIFWKLSFVYIGLLNMHLIRV